MINGKEPKPFKSCPFRMGHALIDTCQYENCTWWDKEKQQCVVWTIAEDIKK